MVEPRQDARQVAHAVAVRVLEGARVDLVDDAAAATKHASSTWPTPARRGRQPAGRREFQASSQRRLRRRSLSATPACANAPTSSALLAGDAVRTRPRRGGRGKLYRAPWSRRRCSALRLYQVGRNQRAFIGAFGRALRRYGNERAGVQAARPGQQSCRLIGRFRERDDAPLSPSRRVLSQEPERGDANLARKLMAALLIGAVSLSLAACGRTPGGRAVSGGLLGAGAGRGCERGDGRQCRHWRPHRRRCRRGRRRPDGTAVPLAAPSARARTVGTRPVASGAGPVPAPNARRCCQVSPLGACRRPR